MPDRRAPSAPLAHIVLAALLVQLGGCRPGASTSAAPASAPGPSTASAASPEAGPNTGGASDGAAQPGSRVAPATRERVAFRTADGWTLAGELIPEPAAPVVILVHQLSSNRSEWEPLVARLHAGSAPLATLAIDLRGHGESTRGPDGPTPWQSFGSESAKWAGVVTDVGAAVSYVRARVAANAPIVLVGSSIGSTAVLRAAADDPAVAGVVLLSPGTAYRGLDTLEPMARYAATGRPALLVAAAGDRASADAVGRLAGRASGHAPVEQVVYPDTAAHGVAMAAEGAHPELWARVETWIRGALHPTAPTGPRD